MLQLHLNGLSIETFLAEYWQKKPVLLKGGFRNFVDPISPDELAGLATDENIESRIVSNAQGNWSLDTGPFEDFSSFGEQDWTLLVQAVDHWHPDAAKIIEPFRFIPNWRIDDLMVSYSTPGGGVGPHLDQYDVFIIQGLGRRRWRVGMPDATLTQHCPHPRLLQVSPFQDCINVITEPGDILYIPPGCPHDGISLENSLNYSVGFRAPAQKDLITGLADYLIDADIQGTRFTDPQRKICDFKGEISRSDRSEVKQQLLNLLQDDALFDRYFGSYITHAKHELDLSEPDPHYQQDEIADYLAEGSVLARAGGLRCCYIQTDATADILLFINGTTMVLPHDELSTVHRLTEQTQLGEEDCRYFCENHARLAFITMLINQGYWYFIE